MHSENKARQDLAEVCQLAYGRGYICGTEGNFSVRLDKDLVLSTPRGICKGKAKPEDMVLCDLEGNVHESVDRDKQRPSTELPMHLTAYKLRPDIFAVAHAHPTAAVGFSVAGKPLTKCILPEIVCMLGAIPTARYATPSTDEVSKSIAELITQYDALVLDHHGALTIGSDIWDAFYKLEMLEHHAQTMLVAHMLGGVKPLYASQVANLLKIRKVYGQERKLPEKFLTGVDCALPDLEGVN